MNDLQKTLALISNKAQSTSSSRGPVTNAAVWCIGYPRLEWQFPQHRYMGSSKSSTLS